MKTRTLLLLALGCGLLIMVAGAVLLFQLSTQESVVEPIPIGIEATVADMRVLVSSSTELGDVIAVDVAIGGVDDPDGASGFRLIAGGRSVPFVTGDDEACGATAAAELDACTVRFDLSGVDGRSRVLFYERGEQRARWVLA